jgi:hypothetical protein
MAPNALRRFEEVAKLGLQGRETTIQVPEAPR